MLMGLFIFSLLFVGFVAGSFTMRFFVQRGAGQMAVCGRCKYKNMVAGAGYDDYNNIEPPEDESLVDRYSDPNFQFSKDASSQTSEEYSNSKNTSL